MTNRLVLIPGFAMTSRSCMPAFGPIKRAGYEITVPAIKFKKASSTAQVLDNYLSELHDYIVKSHLREFQLVGISLGGLISMGLAAKYPDLPVHKLILIDPAGYNDKNRFMMCLRILRMGLRMLTIPKAFKHFSLMTWDLILTTLEKPRHIWLSGRVGTSIDIAPIAQTIKIPTTILWGDRDGVIDISCGHNLHKQIHRSKFHIVNGLHSWPHYAVEQLLPFLND